MKKYDLGKIGECKAKRYLEKLGYFIIKTNYKCVYGEIDIIATDKNELVFVEVKSRCSKKYGEARDAVNKYKKKHIKKSAMYYIYRNNFEKNFIRFDVIEVYYRNEKFEINHIKNTLW